MALKIIYGEAGTGKSEYCLNAMLNLFKNGVKTMMIVPEQFAHSAEFSLVQKNGFLSDDISATSFKRLAHKLLQKHGLLKGSLSNVGKTMLLAKAILSVSADLTLYKRAAEKPGFLDAMLQFIDECKRSGVTPDAFLQLSVPDNAYLSVKTAEIGKIFAAYQKNVEAGFTDREDYLLYLSELLCKTDEFRGTYIFIDEFFCFTRAELDVILAFCLAGADVCVTLGCDGERSGGLFEPVSKTAALLTALAKEKGITVCEPIILKEKHRFSSAELAHFEKEYAAYNPKVYEDKTKNLSLYIAPDLYTEVQALAAAICRKAEEGLRYRDMAIIVGDTERYTDLIKTVFPIYNIPVHIDDKRPLFSHPIMVMLFSLLELLTGGIETETLLSYAKTGYAGLSFEECDRLENYALAGRLRRGDWLSDERFLERADSIFEKTENLEESQKEDAAELLSIKNRLLAPILSLKKEMAENRKVKERASALVAFFESIRLYETVQTEISAMEERGDLQQAKEQGEIYNLLIALLDELVICLGEETIGLERLSSIILAGLGQCEISTIPSGSDQVFLGDESRSLIKNVKALFVIGANDGSFPAPPSDDGLLRDSERKCLEKQGISLGPDGENLVQHNQYAAYHTLHIASDSIYFSYAVSDHEGKGIRPSALIYKLKKIFPNLSVSDNLLESPSAERLVAGKASAWQYLLEHFRENNPVVSGLHKVFAADPDYAVSYKAVADHLSFHNRAEDLSKDVARSLYGRDLRGSVSQLERYENCPYSYFIQYGLRAKERKIMKIDTPDIGTLLHNLVEMAGRRLAQTGEGFGSVANEEAAMKLADEIVTELFSELFITKLYSENRLAALIKRMKRLVAKFLFVIGNHVARGEFEPFAYEVAFDENGELPPVKLSLPTGETITLRGRIDRIDTLRKEGNVYIKIIDYKSGNKTFNLSDVYNGLSLQLAVYLTAVVEGGESFAGGKAKPAGMLYFRLADKTISAADNGTDAMLKQFKMSGLLLSDVDIIRAMDKGISGYSSVIPAYIKQDGTLSDSSSSIATLEQFKQLSAHVKRVAGEIGRKILQGETPISPCKSGGGLPCRYCKFRSICGFDAQTDDYRVALPFKDDVVWAMLDEEDK